MRRSPLHDVLVDLRSARLEELAWPRDLRVVVLAPHPDDFDGIAVTMRFFRDRGDTVHLGVVTLSPRGVEDRFVSPPTSANKAAIREAEQRASCKLFGLPDDHLTFLGIVETASGDPIENDENFERVRAYLAALRPHLVLLPHGNDPNVGHLFTFHSFVHFARAHDEEVIALLNRDPKTIDMRVDLRTFFDEETAEWKATLLRCHRSQQERSRNVRGQGIDERVLQLNRDGVGSSGAAPYAEELEVWFPLPRL